MRWGPSRYVTQKELSPRGWLLPMPMPARSVRTSSVPPAEIERRLASLLPCVEETARALAFRHWASAARADVRSLVLDCAWRVAAIWRADGGASLETLLIGCARRDVRRLSRESGRPSGFARGQSGRGRAGDEPDPLGITPSRTHEIGGEMHAAWLLEAIRRRLPERLREVMEALLASDGDAAAAGRGLGITRQRVLQLRQRIADRCLNLLSQGDESEREVWRRRLGLAGKEARKRRRGK